MWGDVWDKAGLAWYYSRQNAKKSVAEGSRPRWYWAIWSAGSSLKEACCVWSVNKAINKDQREREILILQRLWEEPEEYSEGCAERDVVRMEDTVVGSRRKWVVCSERFVCLRMQYAVGARGDGDYGG